MYRHRSEPPRQGEVPWNPTGVSLGLPGPLLPTVPPAWPLCLTSWQKEMSQGSGISGSSSLSATSALSKPLRASSTRGALQLGGDLARCRGAPRPQGAQPGACRSNASLGPAARPSKTQASGNTFLPGPPYSCLGHHIPAQATSRGVKWGCSAGRGRVGTFGATWLPGQEDLTSWEPPVLWERGVPLRDMSRVPRGWDGTWSARQGRSAAGHCHRVCASLWERSWLAAQGGGRRMP